MRANPFTAIHHVCLVVDDLDSANFGFGAADVDASEAAATEAGLSIRSRGRRADGTRFTSFETEDQLGVTLEVRSPA